MITTDFKIMPSTIVWNPDEMRVSGLSTLIPEIIVTERAESKTVVIADKWDISEMTV
jgi:hypothetical protein